nr:tyrosine kinase insulin receptor [Callinectes sapidus]
MVLLLKVVLTDCFSWWWLQEKNKNGEDGDADGDALSPSTENLIKRNRQVMVRLSRVAVCLCGDSYSGGSCGEKQTPQPLPLSPPPTHHHPSVVLLRLVPSSSPSSSSSSSSLLPQSSPILASSPKQPRQKLQKSSPQSPPRRLQQSSPSSPSHTLQSSPPPSPPPLPLPSTTITTTQRPAQSSSPLARSGREITPATPPCPTPLRCSRGLWEWRAWVLVMLAVLGAAGECHAQSHHGETSTSTALCPPKRDSSQKICSSMDLRNSVEELARLCHCSIIEGYLHFVLQEQNDSASAAKLKEFTFPELREITEHLLVYRVFRLTTLRTLFPNLTVIRGEVLFYNYALVIYHTPDLVEVGLASLTSILRGSVRIERNQELCHVTTVDWASITSRPLTDNYFNRNKPESECRPCPDDMGCPSSTRCGPGRCWGPGACQILCRSGCPGGCVGGECCHEECVGGCRKPGSPKDCFVCRNFWDVEEGRCSPDCPSGKLKVSRHRCERVQSCPHGRALRLDTRECVWDCPAGQENTTSTTFGRLCRPCQGHQCPRRCPGTNVSSVSHAQALRGCTLIEGGLTIVINGGENVQKELEENLSSIKEVENFIKVFRSNLTSLAFLSSLTRVGGEERLHTDYSVVILDNPNLQELWNASGLTIDRGKILVHANPKLCLHRVHTLANQTGLQGLSETDVSPTSNGDRVPCDITPLRANVSTSPLYGTLTVTVEATQLPGVSVYYVSYMKTDTNISLYDSDQPCSEQGWATVEMSIADNEKDEEIEREELRGIRHEERGRRRGGERIISGTLVNLDPFTRYAVFVKTVSLDSSARGAQSEVMYATTSPYNPSEPENPQWSSPNSSTLKLWWQPPRHPNGVIDHYLVTLVLLLDVPKIPDSLDFCQEQERRHLQKNLQTDPVMRSTPYSDEDEIEDEEDLMDEEEEEYDEDDEEDEGWDKDSRMYWNETRVDGDKEGEVSCRRFSHFMSSSSSSCCACPESPSSESDDGDVLGQIAFEDFIMDSVYVKKAGRGRRRAQERLHQQDAFEKDLRATYQPPRSSRQVQRRRSLVASSDARESHTPLPIESEDGIMEEYRHYQQLYHEEGQGGDFPLYPEERVHEFPSQGGIRAEYQLHESDLHKYNEPLPELGSVLRLQIRQTRNLHVTIHRLLHFSLYSVSIVACQAPEPLLPGTWMKLCSLHPAQTAAYTKPSVAGNQVPAESLKVKILNGTLGSVSLSWEPPRSPNGGVLAYVIKLRAQGPLREERCITHRQFEAQDGGLELDDLSPGNYSVSVRVRTKAKFGPYCEPVFFVIPSSVPEPSHPDLRLVLSVVLGVVGMVAAGLGFWGWKRYHTRYTIPDTMDEVDENPCYRGGFAPAEMFRQEFLFWRDDLKVLKDRPLGKGFFGMVYEGELTHGGKKRVAVKTHTERASKEVILQFLKEAAVMQKISCHHVVRLLGVVGDYSPVYVVMELMENRDLKSFLQRNPRHHVSEEKLVEMAVQAADGMAYLAERRLVHRDLAARNCLLDHNLVLKIGDFGLSRSLKSDYYRKEGQGVLPVKWMAPESLQRSVYSTHSDMWSYGVLLWEMATRGLTPYGYCTNEEVIRLVVEKYATLDRPRDSPQPFQRLMRQCWRYEPRDRPTFLAVTKFLLKHTSHEFQEKFEKVSFYHSRSSDYAKYRQTSKGGFMSGGGRGSDDNASDDIALVSSSSEESDEEILEDGVLRFRTPHSTPSTTRRSPRGAGDEVSTTLLGCKSMCRVAGGVTGPSDWSRSAAPSVLHFYTNVSPDARPGKVLCGAGHSPMVMYGASDDERDLRYAQLALSTPSTPASGSRTPLRTPGSTPHTPFLHPNTAAFPLPSSLGVAGSPPPFLKQDKGESPVSSKTPSQVSLATLPSAAKPKPSPPFYTNLARSLSTFITRTSHSHEAPHKLLRRLPTVPYGLRGTTNTLKESSKWPSFMEGRSRTLPSSTSTCSIPTNLSSAAHTAELTHSRYSSSEITMRVPSRTSAVLNEETASSSLSSILHDAQHSSSNNSEHGDAVHTLSSLPQRSKSKFFRCERVYINTPPRASGSLPDNFFRRLHADYAEVSLPASAAESPKSKSLKRCKKENDPGDIEMM